MAKDEKKVEATETENKSNQNQTKKNEHKEDIIEILEIIDNTKKQALVFSI